MPAEEAVGGTPGGRWGRERWGGRGSLQRQQDVPPPHLAGHRYANDFPGSAPQPWGAVTVPFSGRALQPQRRGGKGHITRAGSVSVAGFVGLCLRVKPALAKSAPPPLPVICHSCCHSSHRTAHTCRCPPATMGACSSADSDSLPAGGGARSSVSAHPCHRSRSPL